MGVIPQCALSGLLVVGRVASCNFELSSIDTTCTSTVLASGSIGLLSYLVASRTLSRNISAAMKPEEPSLKVEGEQMHRT